MHDSPTDASPPTRRKTSDTLAATLLRSHQRSVAFGLRSDQLPEAEILGPGALEELRDRNIALGTHARPVMENLYSQVAGTRSMVMLTDRHGTILHSLGDPDFLERAQHLSLQPGVAWSEQSRGTNAIGTALAEGEPLQIHAHQHFLRAHRRLSCACAPIVDPMGEPLGALDISGDRRNHSQHTLALVRMSAQMVENHMFLRRFDAEIQLHFHSRPEFIGTLLEGMAAFDADGRFLSANRSAAFQLGMPLRALQAHTFGSLFSRGMPELLAQRRAVGGDLMELCLSSGLKVTARLRLREPAVRLPVLASPPAPRAGRAGAPVVVGVACGGLDALRTGDPAMSALLDRLGRLSGRDIPVLVMGETGTGKEILARAIHHDSPRRAGPLVTVNCAALPEHLIESELFGYEEGAFTGARRKGSPGHILQAQGGTLFLDEIGDMPLALQARLLRVLQEREVVPLGGGRPVAVDIAVICATHRDIRALRASGAFRDDLYWRINGLVVHLPPLRERRDLPAIAQRLLHAQAARPGDAVPTLDAAVLALFARHPWPGNIRQLASLLRTAVALHHGETCIGLAHLPEDFLDDVSAGPAVVPPGLPAPGQDGVTGAAPASLQALTIAAIEQCLRQHGGNVSAAARSLGIARNTLYRRLRKR